METLTLDKLATGPAAHYIFHASGTSLASLGETIDEAFIAALSGAGIDSVIALGPLEDVNNFVYSCKYHKRTVDSLEIGEVTSTAVYDSEGTLLLDAGVTITANIPKTFKQRGFDTIFFKKTREELGSDRVRAFKTLLKQKQEDAPLEDINSDRREIQISIAPQRIINDPSIFSEQNLNDREVEVITAKGTPLANFLRTEDKMAGRSDEDKAYFGELRDESTKVINHVFTKLGDNVGSVSSDFVQGVTNKIIGGFLHDKTLLLNMSNSVGYDTKLALVNHAVNVSALAVTIGSGMQYDKEQVLELAYGAVLHNVGMLQVPARVLNKKGKLSAAEKLMVQRHSIFGINVLQRMRGLPISTPFVAYQAHERINGSGYPKKRKGEFIHPFAKIVAIADNYCALTADRPHRKGMIPYLAMEAIVRMCSRGLLESDMVRTFLQNMSLFPIGSWVELTDGSLAKVVETNDMDFTRPVVSVLYENKQKLPAAYRMNLVEQRDIKVKRAFDGRPLQGSIMEGF